MTRSGALLWKEWRDHRTAIAVFAALVPLVSWPVQRWIFKFAEPEWTWIWIVPLCVGLSVAVVASDSFAMDFATSRMPGFLSLPVPPRHHFAVRTSFLAMVAIAFAAWTALVNVALIGSFGKPGALGLLFDVFEPSPRAISPAIEGMTVLAMCACAVAAIVLLSSLGVGGLRAVIGGALLAVIAFVATDYATDRFFPLLPYNSPPSERILGEWLVATAVISAAAYAGFAGAWGRSSRKRGTLMATAILVVAFGGPAGAATWKVYRSWIVSPDDPAFTLAESTVSPDGRYVAVVGMTGGKSTYRSWIVRVADGEVFDWPRRGDYTAGWTAEGLVWTGRADSGHDRNDVQRFVDPETGDVVERPATGELAARLVSGGGIGQRWCNWLRYDWKKPGRRGAKGVAPTYTWRLWVKDGELEREVEGSSMPAPMPTVGQVLYVNPDGQLALFDLSGGDPRIVADDAVALQSQLTGSPDGRRHIVFTSKGAVVLDSANWERVAGPFTDSGVYWCGGSPLRSVITVTDNKTGVLTHLVDVANHREIALSFPGISGRYGSVQTLPDGGFVALANQKELVLLDADGRYVRHLFPPAGN